MLQSQTGRNIIGAKAECQAAGGQYHDGIANVSLMPVEPQIIHHFSDGLYAKQVTLRPGEIIAKHTHTYEHLSILASGSVIVMAGDSATHYQAPACITISANVEHSVYTENGATWFCIHATDETDPDKVDDVLIGRGGE